MFKVRINQFSGRWLLGSAKRLQMTRYQMGSDRSSATKMEISVVSGFNSGIMLQSTCMSLPHCPDWQNSINFMPLESLGTSIGRPWHDFPWILLMISENWFNLWHGAITIRPWLGSMVAITLVYDAIWNHWPSVWVEVTRGKEGQNFLL